LANPWVNEAWRLIGLLIVVVLLGWLFDQIKLFLILLLVGYLAWHLRNLYQLELWYRLRRQSHPPDASGIWGEVFEHVYRIQQRDRQRKRRLAAIVSRFNESTAAMPDGTVILDKQGHIEWVNKAANQFLGLHPTKDVGQRIDNLIRNPRFIEFFSRGDYTRPLEMPSPVDDNLFLLFRIVPYGNDQRLMVVRNISRLKHLEQVRQDFVANVSHELRTPLTVINGYLENIIDNNGECVQRWGKALVQMQTQSRRMTRIVEDLLLLSRLDSAENNEPRDAVAVPNILLGLKEQAEVVSGENRHTFSIEVDQGLWLQGNEKILHSVFANLIFNAVQYTPAGGSISIRWFEQSDGAVFEVRDTGIGIAPQHIPRLTERFYRVDPGRSRAAGGTGLGLAIVNHGIQRHGGHLHIESKVGEGSCFHVTFPRDLILRRGK
jgi:two-component system phosphate regulon sensor histidine kinase PhoR